MKKFESFKQYNYGCRVIFLPCFEHEKDVWDGWRIVLGRSDDNIHMAIFISDDDNNNSTTYIASFEVKPDAIFSSMNDLIKYLEDDFDENSKLINGLIKNKIHIYNILEHMFKNGTEVTIAHKKIRIWIETPEDLREQVNSLYNGIEKSEKIQVYLEAEKFNM